MLVIPGQAGKDTCDGVNRRELLRVGGSAMLGLSLADMFRHQRAAGAEAPAATGGPGWGKAKSVIMIFLQGGPSHLDLWDPKPNVPDNVRSVFNPIDTKTARPASHGADAEAGEHQRQADADPLGKLHAEWPVQSHGRHLSDADRLHDRSRPARRASWSRRARRIFRTSVRTSFASSRRPCRCCRS